MLALISPAKKLNFDPLEKPLPSTEPAFPKEANSLVKVASKLSRPDLQRLMKLSDNLTELNFQRFKSFAKKASLDNSKQAGLAFAGDTYTGLEAPSLSEDDLLYAQNHLRILSGLYGLLRPLDIIQPYRLEMGSRLANPQGSDLYDFWGDKLRDTIDNLVADHAAPTVINLASNEYFKAARAKTMKSRVITPVFKEEKQGVTKVIGLFAKRARGTMARYIIENRLEQPEKLKSFTKDGYSYNETLSDTDNWVFVRK
ncbi:MAG: peroxide stress protein YaaA [Rhodospirillales bacterium]|nr:peroxide stress protein YaaA [Rhodospirillales bacterium]